MPFSKLEPKSVWQHFKTLCDIPRPSKHEQPLRDHLQAWAEARGLTTRLDSVGNLIIRKSAQTGMENRRGVILQGHLDMVCQQNAGTGHDFLKDPIRPVLKDGWLVAEHTTLGADNGIGVAMALALLESNDVPHGPIEALFTLDEEAGMGGALGLDSDVLEGDLLINIDTEDWGEFYLGCAGGIDVNVNRNYEVDPVPAGHVVRTLTVKGLRGGHSGINIHQGRGNAIKLLIRLLRELGNETDLRVARVDGGTARNALAREAMAVVSFPATDQDRTDAWLEASQALLRFELAGIDEGVTLSSSPAEATQVMAQHDQQRILAALHAAPHGVRRMSQRVPGVVETSNNLGVLSIADGRFETNFMLRSLLDSGTRALTAEIVDLFSLIGAKVETEGGYPGWTPNPDSKLLALFQKVYDREFGGQAEVKVIHAGLECGILAAKYPKLDMVSFGPDIRGAHAPGERVEVESVGKAWHLLKAVLAEIPERA